MPRSGAIAAAERDRRGNHAPEWKGARQKQDEPSRFNEAGAIMPRSGFEAGERA